MSISELKLATEYGYKVIQLTPNIKKIYIEPTTLCNFDCTTCIRNSWEEPLGRMDWGLFEQLLQQLKSLPNLEAVHFGGFGEPLSHPRIFDMIAGVKELGLKAEMITNGSLLTDEVIDKLINLKIDELYVSLDSPEEADYNEIRQGADYNSVIANLRKFAEVKKAKNLISPLLGIEFVAMKKNYHQLPKMVSLIEELQAKLIITNILPYSADMQDQIVYDLDDTCLPFGEESLRLLVRAQMPHMKLRTERFCKFIANDALAITWDGNVSPCYALMHSYKCYIYNREKQMYPYHTGNIAKNTLADIWTSPDYAIFRSKVRDFKFPSCTDCRCLEGCSYTDDNKIDCWTNSPSCADCLWARGMIVCP